MSHPYNFWQQNRMQRVGHQINYNTQTSLSQQPCIPYCPLPCDTMFNPQFTSNSQYSANSSQYTLSSQYPPTSKYLPNSQYPLTSQYPPNSQCPSNSQYPPTLQYPPNSQFPLPSQYPSSSQQPPTSQYFTCVPPPLPKQYACSVPVVMQDTVATQSAAQTQQLVATDEIAVLESVHSIAASEFKSTTRIKMVSKHISITDEAGNIVDLLSKVKQGEKEDVKQGEKEDVKQGEKEDVKQGEKEDGKQGEKEDVKQDEKEDVKQGEKEDVKQGEKEDGKQSTPKPKSDGKSQINQYSQYGDPIIENVYKKFVAILKDGPVEPTNIRLTNQFMKLTSYERKLVMTKDSIKGFLLDSPHIKMLENKLVLKEPEINTVPNDYYETGEINSLCSPDSVSSSLLSAISVNVDNRQPLTVAENEPDGQPDTVAKEKESDVSLDKNEDTNYSSWSSGWSQKINETSKWFSSSLQSTVNVGEAETNEDLNESCTSSECLTAVEQEKKQTVDYVCENIQVIKESPKDEDIGSKPQAHHGDGDSQHAFADSLAVKVEYPIETIITRDSKNSDENSQYVLETYCDDMETLSTTSQITAVNDISEIHMLTSRDNGDELSNTTTSNSSRNHINEQGDITPDTTNSSHSFHSLPYDNNLLLEAQCNPESGIELEKQPSNSSLNALSPEFTPRSKLFTTDSFETFARADEIKEDLVIKESKSTNTPVFKYKDTSVQSVSDSREACVNTVETMSSKDTIPLSSVVAKQDQRVGTEVEVNSRTTQTDQEAAIPTAQVKTDKKMLMQVEERLYETELLGSLRHIIEEMHVLTTITYLSDSQRQELMDYLQNAEEDVKSECQRLKDAYAMKQKCIDEGNQYTLFDSEEDFSLPEIPSVLFQLHHQQRLLMDVLSTVITTMPPEKINLQEVFKDLREMHLIENPNSDDGSVDYRKNFLKTEYANAKYRLALQYTGIYEQYIMLIEDENISSSEVQTKKKCFAQVTKSYKEITTKLQKLFEDNMKSVEEGRKLTVLPRLVFKFPKCPLDLLRPKLKDNNQVDNFATIFKVLGCRIDDALLEDDLRHEASKQTVDDLADEINQKGQKSKKKAKRKKRNKSSSGASSRENENKTDSSLVETAETDYVPDSWEDIEEGTTLELQPLKPLQPSTSNRSSVDSERQSSDTTRTQNSTPSILSSIESDVMSTANDDTLANFQNIDSQTSSINNSVQSVSTLPLPTCGSGIIANNMSVLLQQYQPMLQQMMLTLVNMNPALLLNPQLLQNIATQHLICLLKLESDSANVTGLMPNPFQQQNVLGPMLNVVQQNMFGAHMSSANLPRINSINNVNTAQGNSSTDQRNVTAGFSVPPGMKSSSFKNNKSTNHDYQDHVLPAGKKSRNDVEDDSNEGKLLLAKYSKKKSPTNKKTIKVKVKSKQVKTTGPASGVNTTQLSSAAEGRETTSFTPSVSVADFNFVDRDKYCMSFTGSKSSGRESDDVVTHNKSAGIGEAKKAASSWVLPHDSEEEEPEWEPHSTAFLGSKSSTFRTSQTCQSGNKAMDRFNITNVTSSQAKSAVANAPNYSSNYVSENLEDWNSDTDECATRFSANVSTKHKKPLILPEEESKASNLSSFSTRGAHQMVESTKVPMDKLSSLSSTVKQHQQQASASQPNLWSTVGGQKPAVPNVAPAKNLMYSSLSKSKGPVPIPALMSLDCENPAHSSSLTALRKPVKSAVAKKKCFGEDKSKVSELSEIKLISTSGDTENRRGEAENEQAEEQWQHVSSRKNKKQENSCSTSRKIPAYERLFSQVIEKLQVDRSTASDLINEVRIRNNGGLKGLLLSSILAQVEQVYNSKSKPLPLSKTRSAAAATRKAASKQQILPQVQRAHPAFNKYDVVTSDEEPDAEQCTICLERIRIGCGRLLECSHLFHSDCIKDWINKRQMSCPNCRTHSLLTEDFPKLGS